MDEMFFHHSCSFGVQPSFGVEDLGVVTEYALVSVDDPGVDAHHSLNVVR